MYDDIYPNVWHVVSNLQHVKARLGMKYRSLCGQELRLSAVAPFPTEDADICPTCIATGRATDISSLVHYEET
jgi:hypothetical protein